MYRLSRVVKDFVMISSSEPIIGEFFYTSSWNIFDSKIVSICCDKNKKDYGCSSYPRSEAQSPDFDHFLTIFSFLELFVLDKPLA